MRRSFTVVSIGAHTIVIAAALYAQIFADSTLPAPHRPILFETSQIMAIDVQLPKPAVRTAVARHAESDDAAPIVPPDHFTPESEHPRGGDVPAVGDVAGDDHDLLSHIIGVGIATPLPAPPPPQAAPPVRLHSGMKAPVKTTDVAPIYPAIAQGARVQGVVILEAVLDAAGRVQSVGVLRSIPLLDQAAVDAVRQWRFTPALLNGEAVAVVMTVTVNFTLQDR
jgi:protein TonB